MVVSSELYMNDIHGNIVLVNRHEVKTKSVYMVHYTIEGPDGHTNLFDVVRNPLDRLIFDFMTKIGDL